ncbi:MAG: lipoyl synthase [Deltaproteobacteria bacterium]|nr:lipoyl synthase [Deltaproteobacteria bacterium]
MIDGVRPKMPGRPSQRHEVKVRLRRAGLLTVCEEARCPNVCECFGAQTATFLIMGKVCTRSCRFCAIEKGQPPEAPDSDEARRLAEAVVELDLAHTVITSVTRDDLPDGGAAMFAACIREIKHRRPETTVEVLVPDFAGRKESLTTVLLEKPEVLNHNVETVARLVDQVRPGASLKRSLSLLRQAAETSDAVVKSGLMVGLGEEDSEVGELLGQLADAGCRVVTIGQYLQPSKTQCAVQRQVSESAFSSWRSLGHSLGLHVVAGPLVRSSYQAKEVLDALRLANGSSRG